MYPQSVVNVRARRYLHGGTGLESGDGRPEGNQDVEIVIRRKPRSRKAGRTSVVAA
jgi:hypothetical protein